MEAFDEWIIVEKPDAPVVIAGEGQGWAWLLTARGLTREDTVHAYRPPASNGLSVLDPAVDEASVRDRDVVESELHDLIDVELLPPARRDWALPTLIEFARAEVLAVGGGEMHAPNGSAASVLEGMLEGSADAEAE